MIEKVFEEDTYVICGDRENILHAGIAKKGTTATTGQPYMDEYATLEDVPIELREKFLI